MALPAMETRGSHRWRQPPLNPLLMKTTTITLLAAAAAFGFTACDQAKETAADAAAQARSVAAEAAAQSKEIAAKAESSFPGLKAKAAGALETAKAAGNNALAKGGDILHNAKDWGLEKMGVPEADGLLDGFGLLIKEATTAVQTGMTGEKATALKAKWDKLYAKSSEAIKPLPPEQQEKLKAILATMKAKWDELMTRSESGAVQ